MWRTLRVFGSTRLYRYPRRLDRSFHLGVSSRTIEEILALPTDTAPDSITAVGWIRTIRRQKRITFLELGDGSTSSTLQAVLDPAQSDGLNTGTAVAINGRWQAAPCGTEQANELHAKDVKIYGPCDENFPVQKKYHSPEYLRTIPHLRLRAPGNAAVARLRSEVDYALSKFFRERGFVKVQPPIITSSDCEGAGEVFRIISAGPQHESTHKLSGSHTGVGPHVDFFKEPRYLTVSAQLHLEAFVHEHPRVWTLSPTFRAEKSDTPRHVSEFWMLEAEVRTEDLDELLFLVEDMIRETTLSIGTTNILDHLLSSRRKFAEDDPTKTAADLQLRWRSLTSKNWPRITYGQALGELTKAHAAGVVSFVHDPSSKGLQLEHERWLASEVGKGQPLFVTHYPRSIKPFYMLPTSNTDDLDHDGDTAMCFDLLLPDICEVVGGSLREHRLQSLLRSMQASGMNMDPSASKNPLEWYVDLRRFGSVPHGGFGLGLDRLLSYLSGVSNIKDVVPWPRYHGRCDG